MDNRLGYDFFVQDVVTVAYELIGKELVWKNQRVIITETEAYRGADDPACHAFRGPTPRTQVMFGPPGVSYVYFIYGIHHCLNIVTSPSDIASAVLIRAVYVPDEKRLVKGPGNVCKFLSITRNHNGIDLLTSSTYGVYNRDDISLLIKITTRIGITQNKEALWRFVADVT